MKKVSLNILSFLLAFLMIGLFTGCDKENFDNSSSKLFDNSSSKVKNNEFDFLKDDVEEEFQCPDFFGMNKSQLKEFEEEKGLIFLYEYGTPENDLATKIKVGEIFKQTPSAGSMVKKNSTVTVTFCNGYLKIVNVPDVRGEASAKAMEILIHEGFDVEVVTEYSDVVAGCVIRTDPVYGSKLAPGSKIKLFVSLGILKEPVEVPDVSRHSLEEAKKIIENAGFTVGDIAYVNSEPNYKGYVVSQSPEGGNGKMAEKGSAINLNIGNGITVYKFNLNVALPSDYVNDHGYISAWIDNIQVNADQYAGKVEISKLKNATFNISTEKPSVQVTIKLSADNVNYHNYITYTVDATTGSITDIYEYAYPQKITDNNGSDDTDDDSDGSTNTSQGDNEGV